MCLEISYAEALFWRDKGQKLVVDAVAAAQAMAPDPLLLDSPELSALVSAVDSIKKRHGLLIEEALIYAINSVPNWKAEKVRIPSGRTYQEVDCLAFNAASGLLYVFECKRGHGNPDKSSKNAIDTRLEEVTRLSARHAILRGWNVFQSRTFIVSFYGRKWRSKFEILSMEEVATVFPPCAFAFTEQFRSYTETETARSFERRSRRIDDETVAVLQRRDDNIFDTLDLPRNEGRRVSFNGRSLDPR